MDKLFSDEEWTKRFNNHEVILRELGYQLVNTNKYLSLLEARVENQNQRIKVLTEINKVLSERVELK